MKKNRKKGKGVSLLPGEVIVVFRVEGKTEFAKFPNESVARSFADECQEMGVETLICTPCA